MPRIRRTLGLSELPAPSTLCKAFNRLDMAVWRVILTLCDATPDEREEIQAELDAAAFQAYGLDREQTEFILDDFYQVQNPRRMTDEYLDLVLKKYDDIPSSD